MANSFNNSCLSTIILCSSLFLSGLIYAVFKIGELGLVAMFISIYLFRQIILRWGYSVREDELIKGQKKRNKIANRVLEGKEDLSFSLYLRPFITSGRVPIKVKYKPGNDFLESMFSDDYFGKIKYADFETVIASILEPLTPLVALGSSFRAFGSGKANTTEDYWKEDFLELSKRATTFFIVPLKNKSTMWEVNFLIKSDKINRCIFFMPSKLMRQDIKSEWPEAQKAYKVILDFSVPEFIEEGMLYSCNSRGEVDWALEIKDLASYGDLKSLMHMKIERIQAESQLIEETQSLNILNVDNVSQEFEKKYKAHFPSTKPIRDRISIQELDNLYTSLINEQEKQPGNYNLGNCENCASYVRPTSKGICPNCRKQFRR